MRIGNPHLIGLLLVVAVGLLLTGYGMAMRLRLQNRLASGPLRDYLFPRAGDRRRWRSSLLLAGCLILLALAAIDIRWGQSWQQVPQRGIELLILLDVSRSMLAEDVAPNRLERAKQQINDLLDEMAGDRVGLIAYAGDARQVIPLTRHRQDFRRVLDQVGPHSVNRGGSRLGHAITVAANSFMSKTNDHKAVVIFSDGGDQQSDSVDVAESVYEQQGIRIFTVGLGNPDQGARIPNRAPQTGRAPYVRYQGQLVRSKLNDEILSEIATRTEGAYIPAETKQVSMAGVYQNYIGQIERRQLQTARINRYVPRFQWFTLPAVLLLLLETYLATRRMPKMTIGEAVREKS